MNEHLWSLAEFLLPAANIIVFGLIWRALLANRAARRA